MRINPILNFNIQSTSKDKQYRNNSHYLSLQKPCQQDVFFKSSKKNNDTAPMTEAADISKIFMKNGFNYTANELHKYLQSEVNEFKQAVYNNDLPNQEEELGDMLFDVIQLAAYYDIDPIKALEKTNAKIMKRFNKIEEISNKPVSDLDVKKFNEFWIEAKKQIKKEEENTNY